MPLFNPRGHAGSPLRNVAWPRRLNGAEMKVRLLKDQPDTDWGFLKAGTVIDHQQAEWLTKGGKKLLADPEPDNTPADVWIDEHGQPVKASDQPAEATPPSGAATQSPV